MMKESSVKTHQLRFLEGFNYNAGRVYFTYEKEYRQTSNKQKHSYLHFERVPELRTLFCTLCCGQLWATSTHAPPHTHTHWFFGPIKFLKPHGSVLLVFGFDLFCINPKPHLRPYAYFYIPISTILNLY